MDKQPIDGYHGTNSFGALDSSELKNPLLKQIAELYNKYSSGDLAFQTSGCGMHSKGSHHNHSKGGGGCYVTTACLDALGLPRDSLEMKAIKVLTRDHVLKSFSGKRDYVSYQTKGPAIVQAIASQENPQGIWDGIYQRLGDVTASVLSNDYEKGHNQYKELILGLEKQFC